MNWKSWKIGDSWKPSEISSFVSTITAAGVSVGLLFSEILLVQVIASGALGGLIHELAQSGGKIFFWQKRDDGIDIGSLAGMVLGSVAGVIALQGYLPPPELCIEDTNNSAQETTCKSSAPKAANSGLLIEIFLAGLALKGISQAASASDNSTVSNETTANNKRLGSFNLSLSEEESSVAEGIKGTLQALDSEGNPLISYTGTVGLYLADGSSDPSAIGDFKKEITFDEEEKGQTSFDITITAQGKYKVTTTDTMSDISSAGPIQVSR